MKQASYINGKGDLILHEIGLIPLFGIFPQTDRLGTNTNLIIFIYDIRRE
jgi:hypothetical protein